eukprot:1196215-Prorocentrum_minimum.AAC.3
MRSVIGVTNPYVFRTGARALSDKSSGGILDPSPKASQLSHRHRSSAPAYITSREAHHSIRRVPPSCYHQACDSRINTWICTSAYVYQANFVCPAANYIYIYTSAVLKRIDPPQPHSIVNVI